MGSLTAWQMLAADVQRDMDEAAAAAEGPLRRFGSRSQLEQPGGSLAGEGQPSGSGHEQEPEGPTSSRSMPPQPAGSSDGGGSGGSGGNGSSGEAVVPLGSLGSGELDE